MLNFIWAGMLLVGIIYAVLTGRIGLVTEAMLDSAGEGVSLCLTMAGAVAFWMGLMEIAESCGLTEKMAEGLAPVLRFCFPRIPVGHPALSHIASNMIANILGLGWACTPAGLKAMEALADLEAERGNEAYRNEGDAGDCSRGRIRIASNEMCTFLILNISSLQLIPVNLIAYRSRYGSLQPTAIIGPSIAATFVSTLAAVIFCKCADKKERKNPCLFKKDKTGG